MRTLRLVARFGCFDRTYEGLKRASVMLGVRGTDPRFDRTYEGLKHGEGGVSVAQAGRHRFDRTYEGLKPPLLGEESHIAGAQRNCPGSFLEEPRVSTRRNFLSGKT